MQRRLSVIESERARNLGLFKRRYMLTHDDDTSEILVYIDTDFSNYELSDKKDEFFGSWSGMTFQAICHLDNPNSKFPTYLRKEIFKSHIKNVLISIMRAERLFDTRFLQFYVEEFYLSSDENIREYVCAKTLKDYIWDKDGFSNYSEGFDYSKLKNLNLLKK